MAAINMQTKRRPPEQKLEKKEQGAFIEITHRFAWLYREILEEVRRYAKSTDVRTLHDVGCANGVLLNMIGTDSTLDLLLSGSDIDGSMQQKIQDSNIDYGFFVESVYDLSVRADIITCNLSLHHFPDGHATEAIKKMYEQSNRVVIVSDQLRPESAEELRNRLRLRERFIAKHLDGYKVPYYGNRRNEMASILEAYSGTEIEGIVKQLQQSGMHVKLRITDNDYYQRFVMALEKPCR